MSVTANAETLRQIPIFRDCDPIALQVMAFAAERQSFIPGEAVISQGRKAKAAFLIMSGTAAILNHDTEIGIAEPGAFLGEMAMIGGTSYAVSAIAQDSLLAARIDHGLFLRVAAEYPEFGRSILRVLSSKLQNSMRELDEIRAMLGKSKGFSDL